MVTHFICTRDVLNIVLLSFFTVLFLKNKRVLHIPAPQDAKHRHLLGKQNKLLRTITIKTRIRLQENILYSCKQYLQGFIFATVTFSCWACSNPFSLLKQADFGFFAFLWNSYVVFLQRGRDMC